MAFKKSKLFAAIWDGCNKLRGGMDSSQYKDYVLTLLFVKYVSDKAGDPKSIITVPKGASFADMAALKNKPDIGDRINTILAELAKANDLVGVVDIVDFNDSAKLGSGKDMVDRLSGLVGIFEHPDLDFKKHRAGKADILGDAYEYLMKKFATESGKSKGQFYTPAEVSIILSWLIGSHMAKQGETIYDPTCGSGSLLLRCYAEAFDAHGVELSVHGQEMDVSTYGLSKINMVLHGLIDAVIMQGSTLSSPKFLKNHTAQAIDGLQNAKQSLKTFKYIVANPPFSAKEWSTGIDPEHDVFGRFEMGIPPAKNGDYAFVQHIAASLDADGKAAVVLPHGVLFRGNVESTIRKALIKKGWIRAIVGLPANLFFGTGIPACILLLDKEAPEKRDGIYMIDASKGFIKDGNKNKLRARDMRKIMDAFEAGLEIEKFSRFVSYKEIDENDGNLNLPRYIDSSEPEDIQDLGGHLQGGIPESDVAGLRELWDAAPSLKGEIFKPSRAGYLDLNCLKSAIRDIFDANPEIGAFKKSVAIDFDAWKTEAVRVLRDFSQGERPRSAINSAGDAILKAYESVALIGKYDVYQKLMELWEDCVQDDLFIVAEDGWLGCKSLYELQPKEKMEFNIEIGSGKGGKRYQSDVIDPLAVAKRYFTADLALLEKKEAELSLAEQSIDDAMEEMGSEEGALSSYIEDGKWASEIKKTKTTPKVDGGMERLKQVADLEAEFGSDAQAVKDLLANLAKAKKLKPEVADLKRSLWSGVLQKIESMTEDEIKQSVIEDKWLAKLAAAIDSEAKRVLQSKITRIEELASRYEAKLDTLESKRAELAKKNAENMKLLGF